jgi:hypothetical protein
VTVRSYVRELSDNTLQSETIEWMNHAIGINNSGTFRIAIVCVDEMIRRGIDGPQLRTFRDQAEAAVLAAEAANL